MSDIRSAIEQDRFDEFASDYYTNLSD